MKVDGESKGAIESYSFENVTNNHTIDVLFSDEYNVSDEESFRAVVATGGIINLASDILLTNRDVRLESDLTINGGSHSISGSGVFRFQLIASNEVELTINNGNFDIISFSTGSKGLINDGFFNGFVLFDRAESLIINGGLFEELCVDINTTSGSLIINGGTFKKFTKRGDCTIDVKGGTFYDDLSEYVDTSTHTITQTTDAEGNDIWVVTEK